MTDLIYRHPNPEFLEGLNAIAEFIGCSRDDVKRAILKDGLPAIKLPEGQFFTTKKCVMAWVLHGYEELMQRNATAEGGAAATKVSPIIEITRSTDGRGTPGRSPEDESETRSGRAPHAQEGAPLD